MPKVYLGLGSNIENRISYLKNALKEIGRLKETRIIKCSSVYQTEPWGIKEQGAFLNIVVLIETNEFPAALIGYLKEIEIKCGRVKRDKWFKREIDIDILFYDDVVINSGELEIPHPQVQNRKFALVPLNEIAPELIHPVFKESVNSMLDKTNDKSDVRLYKGKI